MPGENILVVDDSVAVQELCRATLESQGYRVSTASNGVAAMSYPDLPGVDLLVIDTHLRGMTGLDTSKAVKQDPELHRTPILLLVPEEEASSHESQDRFGADAWLAKPFEPALLARKVQVLMEERRILEHGRESLKRAAEELMKRLADTQIQAAIDQKTQIIVERALQSVVTQVDQRARREVDAKVTALAAEKEQELVKATVQEVARSLVEKLAEKKVTEAMEVILKEETEKAVRRAAESMLPGLVRDRIREGIEQMLPKEVQRRVQKEAEDLVPEASQKVVAIIDQAAQKIVPKAAREILGEVTERTLEAAIEKQLPRHVQLMVSSELEAQIRTKIAPLVKESADGIRARLKGLFIALLVAIALATGLLVANRAGLLDGLLKPEADGSGKVPAAAPTPAPAPTPIFRNPFAGKSGDSAPTSAKTDGSK